MIQREYGKKMKFLKKILRNDRENDRVMKLDIAINDGMNVRWNKIAWEMTEEMIERWNQRIT